MVEGIIKIEQGLSSVLFIIVGIINIYLKCPIEFCILNIILGFCSFLNHSIQERTLTGSIPIKLNAYKIYRWLDATIIFIICLYIFTKRVDISIILSYIFFNYFYPFVHIMFIFLIILYFYRNLHFKYLFLFYNLLAGYVFIYSKSDVWLGDIRWIWHICVASCLLMTGYNLSLRKL